jgi:hypothetical protein
MKLGMTTSAAVGFGPFTNSIQVWLPRNYIRQFEYDDGGDSPNVRLGELVRSVHIPAWLARDRKLEVYDE